MRVAYLVNQYPKVSHTFIRREILALEAAGVEVDRYALRGWDAEVVDPADIEERARTRHTLQQGVGPLILALLREILRQPGAIWRALLAARAMARTSARPLPFHLIYVAHACRLLTWLRASPVDHLHAHFGTNSAEVAMLLRLLGGPSYSFTVHGPDEIDDAKRIGLDRTIGGAAFVVAISSYTKSQLMRRIPTALWPKIRVVHCGLPDTAFAASAPPLPEAPRFLCIGRFNEQKGHQILLEAFAEVRADVPEAELVLAGDGELRAEIEAEIARLGLGEAVRITGWIASDAVRAELEGARILVQPSLMEGLPVVIMEALAQFRPVISTYVAGIPELVRPGETGWLVPAGDPVELAATMLKALNTPTDRLSAMAAAGHSRTRTRHSVTTEADKLAALFEGAG